MHKAMRFEGKYFPLRAEDRKLGPDAAKIFAAILQYRGLAPEQHGSRDMQVSTHYFLARIVAGKAGIGDMAYFPR